MRRRKNEEAQAAIDRRRERVGELLRERMGISAIAKELHVSAATIHADAVWLQALHREQMFGAAADVVFAEDERLQDIDRQLIARARELSNEPGLTELWLRVIDRRLRVFERRAKMLGLDAPEEINLSVTQLHTVITRLLAIIIHEIPDGELRRMIVVKVSELLEQHGAGTCLQLLGRPESKTSSEGF